MFGLIGALACLFVVRVSSHGRLIDPPARNSMWRFGFSNPPNFNDNELNCGGFSYQWSNEGKCGVCGDPFGKAQLHVYPGKYANNIITKTYNRGRVVTVKVELTSNHKGFFEFKIGDIGTAPITEGKLAQVLKIAGTDGTRYYLPAGSMNGIFTVSLRLPMNLVCKQCVLQWRYTTGNNWGTDETGSGVGKGPQETFVNCADVSIVGDDGTVPTGQIKPAKPVNRNPAPVPQQPAPAPPSGGSSCKGAGAYAGQPTIDAWCQSNCPTFCPTTHCTCT